MAAEEKWYFNKKQLESSPSRKCEIDADKELSYRQQAANFIQDVGQRLQVTQLCINTAIVYMHRFYVFHSFSHFYRYAMAAAALFLAAKVEEQPRKLEHVIKVAHLCLHKESENPSPAPDVKSEQYANLAHDLVFNENVLLQTLGFDVAIDHPHTHVVRCCHLVKASKDLAQTSYFLASNSLHLTTMCLQYKPTVVACFCIHLACKWSNWEIPRSNEGKLWFTYVDEGVTLELLDNLTQEFMVIYNKCPSRLKKKIMSMSNQANQTQGSSIPAYQGGSTYSTSTGGVPHFSDPNSPMMAEPKKVAAPMTKEGVSHHSKSHHSQSKPGPSHQHRASHDPNTTEHKEKKERSNQGHGVPHHKPLLPTPDVSKHPTTTNSINHKHNLPPGSNLHRNSHHRSSASSSNSNIDPKLKMHPQYNSQHVRSSNAPSRPDAHPVHSRSELSNQYQRSMEHLPSNNRSDSASKDPGARESISRDANRDLHREQLRAGQTTTRDLTAPRDSFHNREHSKELFNNSDQRDNKDHFVNRHSNSSETLAQNKDNFNRDTIGRERQLAEQNSQSSSRDAIGYQSGVSQKHNRIESGVSYNCDVVNKDSIDKVPRFESNRSYKPEPNSNKQISNTATSQAPNSNNSKHENRHKSSRDFIDSPQIFNKANLKPSESRKSAPPDKMHINRPPYPGQTNPSQKFLSPFNANAQDTKNLFGPTSSPGNILSQSLDQSRNGNHNVYDESQKRIPETETLSPLMQTPPPVQKVKSIFSPEKETPKPLQKRSRSSKTPPNSMKRPESSIPLALSPFGSPLGNKNRNRTSSSSSEPELMVSVTKLENIKGFENMVRDHKSGIKLSKENYNKDDFFSNVKKEFPNKGVDKYDLPGVITSESNQISNSLPIVNGIETDPTLISNLLKESTPLHRLSVVDNAKKEPLDSGLNQTNFIPVDTTVPSPYTDEKKSEHHKSEKKKKKEKHKHKDKDKEKGREDKEKKKKHKDKDRDRNKYNDGSSSGIAPLKITIPKDKITPTATPTESSSGLKIKIPKERIKSLDRIETIPPTSSNNSATHGGGLKLKISTSALKEKVVENVSESRKRERDGYDMGGPPMKTSKMSTGASSSSSSYNRSGDGRQNGRSSYNKQVRHDTNNPRKYNNISVQPVTTASSSTTIPAQDNNNCHISNHDNMTLAQQFVQQNQYFYQNFPPPNMHMQVPSYPIYDANMYPYYSAYPIYASAPATAQDMYGVNPQLADMGNIVANDFASPPLPQGPPPNNPPPPPPPE